jgi:hypothetical protein
MSGSGNEMPFDATSPQRQIITVLLSTSPERADHAIVRLSTVMRAFNLYRRAHESAGYPDAR